MGVITDVRRLGEGGGIRDVRRLGVIRAVRLGVGVGGTAETASTRPLYALRTLCEPVWPSGKALGR